MHEISIMQSTLDLAVNTAKASGAKEIHQLRLRIGAMTGVVGEALRFAFEVLREGTLAEQATLEIETVPASSWCGHCQTVFESADWMHRCPKCNQLSSELRSGLELELASMEVT